MIEQTAEELLEAFSKEELAEMYLEMRYQVDLREQIINDMIADLKKHNTTH